MTEETAIAPALLARHLGSLDASLLIDVRREAAFAESDRLIASAIRRDPAQIENWIADLPQDRAIVVYCVHGHDVGRNAAARLRQAGFSARHLEGGIVDWLSLGGPSRKKSPICDGLKPSRWVTRARPKIDRIACPWLIRRFLDPLADFHFVASEEVFAKAAALGAQAFDIPGAPFSHVGEACSFDAFIAAFDLQAPGLDRLAGIVRGADTDRHDLTAESAGLYALSLGLSDLIEDDHRLCETGFRLYDALYRWCRDLQGETHSWPPRPR